MQLRLNKSVLRQRQSEKPASKKYNILLVDDEKENLDSLSLVLNKEYNLSFANNGEEALDMLKRGEVPDELHMIISDQRMPKMTGVELLSEARDLRPDAVRIILTGFTDVDAMISSINEGQIYKFLTKPLDPVDLKVTVRRSLEYYALGQENSRLVVDLKKRVKEVENLLGTFEKFVPRQFTQRVAREGVQNLEQLEIGKAETDRVSVMFVDIRDFTPLAESMQPQQVLDFLNDYFRHLGAPVHAHRGFVDKYLGDGIMALFDEPGEAQADDAVVAAVEMQRAVASYNASRAERGEAPVHVGIGIHTGPVIIGTVGMESRMDLTVLGETVNIAARVEQLTKHFGAAIIVSGQTFEQLGPLACRWRELDFIRVRGREEPLAIFELFADHEPAELAALDAFLPLYDEALRAFYAGEQDSARAAFARALEARPGDLACQRHLDQLDGKVTDDLGAARASRVQGQSFTGGHAS